MPSSLSLSAVSPLYLIASGALKILLLVGAYPAVSTPELTTIHVYKQELGKVAVRRVLDHVQYPGRHEKMKAHIPV